MKIVSITDPTTADGLRLAGVKDTYSVEDIAEAEKLLEENMAREDVGVIITTESLAQELDEKILGLREEKEKTTPILIEIPSKEGPVPERREVIGKLVKRAVGIKLER